MKTSHRIAIYLLFSAFVCATFSLHAQVEENSLIDSKVYKKVRVKPSETNPGITYWDTAHTVYYNPSIKNNKLLVWLAGTNGTPDNLPEELMLTALEQGYKVIALSYITVPAVAQICRDSTLVDNVNCTDDFRRMRIYGDNDFRLIPDQAHDAIIPRLTKLLAYLAINDVEGGWSNYLTTDKNIPLWKNIAVFGQSQGGGMSQYIGQNESVARVISFSGGWDYSNSYDKSIAGWYAKKNVTPMKDWYATYHVNELASAALSEICTTLGIPQENIFALERPLGVERPGNRNPFHGDGIRNILYKPIWEIMLGDGK